MKENRLFLKLFILALFVLTVVFSYPAFKEMKRKDNIQKEILALQEERQELDKNNYFLREKISYFETSDYKERVSKERLNLQKKGERVVSVKFGPSEDEEEEIQDEVEDGEKMVLGKKNENDLPNYKKWWNHFFKY